MMKITYLKKFLIRVKTSLKKFLMVVETSLKKFPMMVKRSLKRGFMMLVLKVCFEMLCSEKKKEVI